MTDPNFSADFDAAINDAVEKVTADEAAQTPEPEEPDTPDTPDEVPEPEPEAPAAEEAAAEEAPAEAEPSEPPTVGDDAIIEVMVNGTPTKMSVGEARKGFMMHAAFTQKTQALAEERKAIAAEKAKVADWIQRAQNAVAQQERIFSDPAMLSAAYLAAQARANGQAVPPTAPQATAPALDPAQLREQIMNEVFSTMAAKQQEAELETAVTTYTRNLFKDDPILSKIDGFEDSVYGAVAQMQPSNPAEAKEYIRLHIAGIKSKLAASHTTQAKAAAVAKAKASTGIERGGSPIVPTKKTYESFDAMSGDIEKMLDSLET